MNLLRTLKFTTNAGKVQQWPLDPEAMRMIMTIFHWISFNKTLLYCSSMLRSMDLRDAAERVERKPEPIRSPAAPAPRDDDERERSSERRETGETTA